MSDKRFLLIPALLSALCWPIAATHAQQVAPQLWIQSTTAPFHLVDSGMFNLLIDGNVVALNVGNGSTSGPYIQTSGSHTVSTTASGGTNLANYIVRFGGDCADDGQGHGIVTLASGDTKQCTVSHLGLPELVVQPLYASPFNIQIDGTNVPLGTSSEGYGYRIVSVGAHKVSVSATTGTNPADYTIYMGGDCAVDGNITLARGDDKSCSVVTEPPLQFITFSINTGDDDLRADSTAIATLIPVNKSNPVQKFTLKSKGEPAWTSTNSKVFQLNPPMESLDFGSIVITLVQGGSFPETADNWHIQGLEVDATDSSGANGWCLFSRSFNPAAALTQSQPSLNIDGTTSGCSYGFFSPLTLSLAPGYYRCPQTVTITEPGHITYPPVAIFATTDGRRPTARSSLYTGPLTVSSSQFIKAIAVSGGLRAGDVAQANYICGEPPPPDPCPQGLKCCGDVVNGKCKGRCSKSCN